MRGHEETRVEGLSIKIAVNEIGNSVPGADVGANDSDATLTVTFEKAGVMPFAVKAAAYTVRARNCDRTVTTKPSILSGTKFHIYPWTMTSATPHQEFI